MPQDIKSLTSLTPYIVVGKVFKYSMDGGKTWRFVKIVENAPRRYNDGSTGFEANAEIGPKGGQASHALTTRGFQLGMIVRAASDSEIAGKRWSFER
jgi:hypothetical protein